MFEEFNVAQLMKAAVAMQVAAMEWESDKTSGQVEASQALAGLREAINVACKCRADMEFATKQRKRAK